MEFTFIAKKRDPEHKIYKIKKQNIKIFIDVKTGDKNWIEIFAGGINCIESLIEIHISSLEDIKIIESQLPSELLY